MPAAPLVGAVTTLPPAAFSSFTASAQRLTQSITVSGSCSARSARSVQQPVERRRAALHLEAAGQDAACRHAAVDAGRHRLADRVEPAVDLLVGMAGALVGAGDVGDAQPLALGDGEQLDRPSCN